MQKTKICKRRIGESTDVSYMVQIYKRDKNVQAVLVCAGCRFQICKLSCVLACAGVISCTLCTKMAEVLYYEVTKTLYAKVTKMIVYEIDKNIVYKSDKNDVYKSDENVPK